MRSIGPIISKKELVEAAKKISAEDMFLIKSGDVNCEKNLVVIG